MCAAHQTSQPMKPLQVEAAEVGDRGLAADGGEIAVVDIAERLVERLPAQARQRSPRGVGALLLGDRRDARQRLAVGVVHRGAIADDEDVVAAGRA